MKMGETFRRVDERPPTLAVKQVCEEDFRAGGYKIRGDVFIELRDGKTGDLQERREINLVVLDASILIARLMKNNIEPLFGIYVLAVGTGNVGWNPMNVVQKCTLPSRSSRNRPVIFGHQK